MTILICVSVFIIASFFGMVIFEIVDPEVFFVILFGLVSVSIALGIIILRKISPLGKNEDKSSDSEQVNRDPNAD